MGNAKSLDNSRDQTPAAGPALEEKSLTTTVSDNALNKKSGSMTADLNKKKYSESNRFLDDQV